MQVGFVEGEGGKKYVCMYVYVFMRCIVWPWYEMWPLWGQCTQEVNVSDFIESTTWVHGSENIHKKSSMHKYVCLLDITCTLQPQASACLTLNWRQQLKKRLENALDETICSQTESKLSESELYISVCDGRVHVLTVMWSFLMCFFSPELAACGGWKLRCLWITSHSRSYHVHLPTSAGLIRKS